MDDDRMSSRGLWDSATTSAEEGLGVEERDWGTDEWFDWMARESSAMVRQSRYDELNNRARGRDGCQCFQKCWQ